MKAQRRYKRAEVALEVARYDRATEMASLRERGHTLEEVGAKYGMTRQRVEQILRWLGRVQSDV